MNTPLSPPHNALPTLHAVEPNTLPWVRWAMRGTQFKLLDTDAATGKFTLLIKVEKGVTAPLHRHVGSVEGFILEGGFHYHDAPHIRFTAGSYLMERQGAIHRPVSPEGAVMFAVFHGPIEGLDEEGNITGKVDWKWHLDTWNAACATTHEEFSA